MTEESFFYDGRPHSRSEIEKLLDKEIIKKQAEQDGRIRHTLRMVEGKNILDVGCAAGDLARTFAERGHNVHAIDVLEESIKIAQEFNNVEGKTCYEVRDLLKNPFPENSFDCVTFLETIEHVENPATYLREFYRILKPGGFLVLSTPNATSLKNILYALSHRKKSKRDILAKEIAIEQHSTGTQLEHINNWDFPTLIRLIDRCGFEYVEHAYARGGPVVIPFFGRKIQLIGVDSNIFSKLNLEPFMTTHIVKARKRSNS
ncbi:MAG: methyltransferase domain-containing protein [Nitrosotalea sp.]